MQYPICLDTQDKEELSSKQLKILHHVLGGI